MEENGTWKITQISIVFQRVICEINTPQSCFRMYFSSGGTNAISSARGSPIIILSFAFEIVLLDFFLSVPCVRLLNFSKSSSLIFLCFIRFQCAQWFHSYSLPSFLNCFFFGTRFILKFLSCFLVMTAPSICEEAMASSIVPSKIFFFAVLELFLKVNFEI